MRALYLVLPLGLLCSACGQSAPEQTTPADEVEPIGQFEDGQPVVEEEEAEPAGLSSFRSATRVEVRVPEANIARDIDDPAQIAALAAAIGEDGALEEAPQCLPKVHLTFMKDDEDLGKLSLCESSLTSGIAQVDVGDELTGVAVADAETLEAVLTADPVE